MSTKQIKGWTQVSEKRWVKGVQKAKINGYAYQYTGSGDWKSSPDDDWDTEVVKVDGEQIGTRRIDGASVKVIKGTDGNIYAATNVS